MPRFLLVVIASLVLNLPFAGVTAGQDSKLSIHGYLTQAYAATDGGQILGIPEEGTTDYRNLALQVRYQMSSSDTFLVQLSHDRVGLSPLSTCGDDVELDWAYYQHDFSNGAFVKVGRAPSPLGIWNKIRDVGTLLPFYSPPFSIYFEGQFTSERVDGVVLGKTFWEGSPWPLDVRVYGGEWTLAQTSQESGSSMVTEATANEGLGAQIWLGTPVPGLRFGVSAQRSKVADGLFQVDEKDTWKVFVASLEGDFEHLVVRAEVARRAQPVGIAGLPISFPDTEAKSYYLQLGYRFDSGWAIHVQLEESDIDFNSPFLPSSTVDLWDDLAFVLSYAFRPDLVLKAEIHDNEGYFAEGTGGSVFTDPPTKTTYGILSLSVSF